MPLRRTPALLVALAALLALPAMPAVAADASPTAQATARRCARRGARASRCRRGRGRARARGVAPVAFMPLFGDGGRLTVIVTLRSRPGRAPQQFVDVRWGSVPMACPSGPRTILVAASALLRGSSFASDVVDPSGARRHLRGRFVSSTRAVGEVRVTFADPRGGGTCDTGMLRFSTGS
jgi:hypothetical protein